MEAGNLSEPSLAKDVPMLARTESENASVAHQIRTATAAIRKYCSDSAASASARLIQLPSPLDSGSLVCPPGGRGKVVLYSTSLQGVRKTFHGCGAVRLLLESYSVQFYERDLSMHAAFKDELRALLGSPVVLPGLFIDGRYIGGVDVVLELHQRGRLMPLLADMPRDHSGGEPCHRCGGAKFTVCLRCNGARKIYDEVVEDWKACSLCNENGLLICPTCSYK